MIRFTKNPSAAFHLGYFEGDKVTLAPAQEKMLIEAGYAENIGKELPAEEQATAPDNTEKAVVKRPRVKK